MDHIGKAESKTHVGCQLEVIIKIRSFFRIFRIGSCLIIRNLLFNLFRSLKFRISIIRKNVKNIKILLKVRRLIK